jgi:hypothetical protein
MVFVLDFFLLVGRGFELRVRQAGHRLSHSSNPFALVCLEVRSCFLPTPAWIVILYFKLPTVLGWQAQATNPALQHWVGVSLAWNHDPHDLSIAWGDMHHCA